MYQFRGNSASHFTGFRVADGNHWVHFSSRWRKAFNLRFGIFSRDPALLEDFFPKGLELLADF